MSAPDENKLLYLDCLQKQLDEIDMLSSIYCNPGEINITDPRVITDFNDYIEGSLEQLSSPLDYTIFIQTKTNEKVEIYVHLPFLYPLIENAAIKIRNPILSKIKEQFYKTELDNYILTLDKNDCYIYQIISWLQDKIDEFLENKSSNVEAEQKKNDFIEFERLWIYSHHLKSKTKRQEIVQNANDLNLSGFSRPGKPGIICVEGLKENTQKFWKIIKSLNWQKITIRKSEVKTKVFDEIDKMRRFSNFKEEIFTDIDGGEEIKMNLSLFMKYLDLHNSSYIKKDLFGFD